MSTLPVLKHIDDAGRQRLASYSNMRVRRGNSRRR